MPPLNLVGDFGGGGMFLAFGITCGLLEASRSGKGQVVDVSMVEGSAVLMHMMYSFMAQGFWQDERGSNMLDGAAHFYDSFETSDGKYVSIGSIEPQFYAQLIELAELDAEAFAPQMDMSQWPALKEQLAAKIKTKTRDEWCAIMEGTDVCFAPILSMGEVADHPHNKARESFLNTDGVLQPAPAPKFSRTRPEVKHLAKAAGSDTDAVLSEAGFSADDIAALKQAGALS